LSTAKTSLCRTCELMLLFNKCCEGLDGSSGWKVERNINRRMTTCSSNFETPKESSCIFNTAYASDSGEYWCENEKGQRSDPINIAVTGGSVILESPAVPVMEGKDVTLRCKAKTTPSNLKADFYKDGFLIRTGSTQEMTIHRLSKCDEGFYKCSIFDSGESTESWLKIRDPALLRVFPDRLQHFEYEEVSFSCEELDGSSGWRVMRMTNRIVKLCAPDWETSNEASCSIETAYPVVDSGKYWCENEKGQRSNAVSITVTAGSVILESPVLPVMEGSDVTLRCKTKTTPSSLTADFYKDGFLIRNSSTGEMTIHSISKSDEGFYKCSISDSGESPESWLDVGGSQRASQAHRELKDPINKSLFCQPITKIINILSKVQVNQFVLILCSLLFCKDGHHFSDGGYLI
uniref:Ig-like domain-containing protein n=1 Tax=Myripristis murdjan TaxID=586833 RepID=A0A667ZF60_9TELE